jgi:molecular chaperone GrpE
MPNAEANMTDGATGTAAEQSAASAQSARDSLESQLQELQDKNLRVVAEMQNMRARMQRDHAESLKYAEFEFARGLLTVVDDLDRTLESAQTATDPKTIAEGVRLTLENLMRAFAARNIEPIDALGEPFDADEHEAIAQAPAGDAEPGSVVNQIARGFKMPGRVLRPARVIVAAPK